MPGISPHLRRRRDVSSRCCLRVADALLGPNCARFQLNLGHLLQRGPGSERAVAASRRGGVERRAEAVARAATRVGDRVRRLHTRERRDAHGARQSPLARPSAVAVRTGDRPAADRRPDRVRGDAGGLRGDLHRRRDSRRRRELAPIFRDAARTSATASDGCAPRRTTTCRARREVAATLPRQAQEVLGYSVQDSLSRGGAYLGMVRMQDPVELFARGEL